MPRLVCSLLLLLATHGTLIAQEAETTPKQRMFEYLAWADARYQKDDATESDFFNLSQVYLSLRLRLGARWMILSETEYEHEPGFADQPADDKVFLERLFVEYRRSATARFRVGRVSTPAGIWKPIHWDITVDTIAEPIMEDNGYIPTNTTGLEFKGTRIVPSGEWEYTVIVGEAVQDDDENARPLDDAAAAGGDLRFTYKERHLMGASVYGYRNPIGFDTRVLGFQGFYESRFLDNRLIFRAESLWLDRRDRDKDITTFYTKLKYRLTPKHYLNYRYEQGDDEESLRAEKRRATTLTWGYWPTRQWRLKAEFTTNRFAGESGPDYNRWSLWTGFVFP